MLHAEPASPKIRVADRTVGLTKSYDFLAPESDHGCLCMRITPDSTTLRLDVIEVNPGTKQL
jgi:hypothetical protein